MSQALSVLRDCCGVRSTADGVPNGCGILDADGGRPRAGVRTDTPGIRVAPRVAAAGLRGLNRAELSCGAGASGLDIGDESKSRRVVRCDVAGVAVEAYLREVNGVACMR